MNDNRNRNYMNINYMCVYICLCILPHMFDPHYSQILYWGIQIFEPKIKKMNPGPKFLRREKDLDEEQG